VTVTATRLCATCGQAFTWTSTNPRRRFCNPKCKARWWRSTRADTVKTVASTDHPAHTDTATIDTKTSRTANAVTGHYDTYDTGYRDQPGPGATQTCPNCHEPVAVINLLVTPAAAYVNTPSRSVTDRHQPQ
jgi:endogenous inhibitor of DNA gyrase (YacG/DUF329 family)